MTNFKEFMLSYGIITLVMFAGWGVIFFALVAMYS